MQWLVTGSVAFNVKGAWIANPAYAQIHPTCIPVHGDKQSKLTLMSESLRNDGRIWVPQKLEDAKALQAGTLQKTTIFPRKTATTTWNAVIPHSVTSFHVTLPAVLPKNVVTGFGVNNTGLAVFLDFSESNRLGKDVVAQRYGNLFDMYDEITTILKTDDDLSGVIFTIRVVSGLTTN